MRSYDRNRIPASLSREAARSYVAYVLDDALSERNVSEMRNDATLVGWSTGLRPVFVAVQSYLPGTTVPETEAAAIATDFLAEINWFADSPTPPDYVMTAIKGDK